MVLQIQYVFIPGERLAFSFGTSSTFMYLRRGEHCFVSSDCKVWFHVDCLLTCMKQSFTNGSSSTMLKKLNVSFRDIITQTLIYFLFETDIVS